jgi:hypothetical protein
MGVLGVHNKMTDKTSGSRRFFDSARVTETVGIGPIYLNKFIERKQYGIEPSVSAGEGRGSRRFFDENDVCGIALVWWLFEAGLRSKTIQYVLNEICGGRKKATANEAARNLLEGDADMIAIRRQPRIGKHTGQPQPKQDVILIISEAFEYPLEPLDTESLLYIPTYNLFEILKESIQKYGVSVGKG